MICCWRTSIQSVCGVWTVVGSLIDGAILFANHILSSTIHNDIPIYSNMKTLPAFSVTCFRLVRSMRGFTNQWQQSVSPVYDPRWPVRIELRLGLGLVQLFFVFFLKIPQKPSEIAEKPSNIPRKSLKIVRNSTITAENPSEILKNLQLSLKIAQNRSKFYDNCWKSFQIFF